VREEACSDIRSSENCAMNNFSFWIDLGLPATAAGVTTVLMTE
jgi:hypothetical protein